MVRAQGLPGPAVAAHPLPTERPFLGCAALTRARRRLARARGSAEGPIVAVVGSHEPRKNHVSVLIAAEQLWRAGRRFRLLFIGAAGWRGERFAHLVEALVAAGRPIEVVTSADETTLWAAYRLARFSVFPSLNEGFGLPVVESLVSGTPVITSNVGSLAEIAAGGGAVVVDPRDTGDLRRAMAKLLDDDDLLDVLRAQIHRRRWKTWDEYAAETWQHLAG
jgi:glycosyltransferase involved in cell wall biosynthesis